MFQRNTTARSFYEKRGLKILRLTDGSGNDEHEPDALYEWHPSVRRTAPERVGG